MLKLALCDDDGEQLAATTALLRQYAAERPELAVKLSFFSSSPSLLKPVEDSELGLLRRPGLLLPD